MLALPHLGFVWLSMPKCASTSVEGELAGDARVVLRGHPSFKHVEAREFQRYVEPLLTACGHPRETYEVVCLFREPIDRLGSWWRYRSRPALKEQDPDRWTGDQSFEEWSRHFLDHPEEITFHSQRHFVSRRGGQVMVDRIFRYESTAVWQGWLADKMGRELQFPVRNASVQREPELRDELRAELRERLAPDYEVYDRLGETGEWVVAEDPVGQAGK